jgi:hypothetical protein
MVNESWNSCVLHFNNIKNAYSSVKSTTVLLISLANVLRTLVYMTHIIISLFSAHIQNYRHTRSCPTNYDEVIIRDKSL